MKCWKSCWITSGTSVQWDRTWAGIIDFDTHWRACVCRENPVWNVYIGSYTTIEAIKAFLFPVKLCAVLKPNWPAPYCLHEGLHSLIWKVLQHFKSCLKTLEGSIPSPTFSPGCLNVSGCGMVWTVGLCPTPRGTPRTRDLADTFRRSVGSDETEFAQDLERKAIMWLEKCMWSTTKRKQFDGNRSRTLGSRFT